MFNIACVSNPREEGGSAKTGGNRHKQKYEAGSYNNERALCFCYIYYLETSYINGHETSLVSCLSLPSMCMFCLFQCLM